MLPFQFDLSKEVVVRAATSTGVYCAAQFQPAGVVLKTFRIESQPKNGIVNVNEKDQRWYYRAKKGFKGVDRFVVMVEGYDRVKWGQTRMFVDIDVQ